MDLDSKILKIHNYIYANEGLSNTETLNEFLKIFYCKILSEKKEGLPPHPTPLPLGEGVVVDEQREDYNGGRGYLDTLFNQLKNRLKGVIPPDEKINLKPETINFILKELKGINFSSISSDIKGHILQKILDRSYRESRGQFFTPAPVVDFMVKMINPKAYEIGLDPACGTGGFMFAALEHSNASIENAHFCDISQNIIKLVAMRMMFEFGIDKGNFGVKDGLKEDFNQKFDYIITNPPFGSQGKISNPEILSQYELGKKFQTPDILFVEKVINLLKDGGRAAILLPKGNFETPSLEDFRKFLVDNVRIDAIVTLPDKTFSPYGTNVQSGIIFFTKTKLPKDYKVFFGQITKLGYTFIKHSKPILRSDGTIDEDYTEVLQNFQRGGTISIKEICAKRHTLSAEFFNPEYQKTIDTINTKPHAKLKDLVKFNYKKSAFKDDKTYNYIEITDINPATDEIFNSSELYGSELPSRASYVLHDGDIIVANSGSSIGTSKHAKALIDKNFEGHVCTNGFTLMCPVKISPYYLMYFFRTDEFRHQILKLRYGSAIPTITKEDFENILVPLPSDDKIETQIRHAIELRKQANEIIKNL